MKRILQTVLIPRIAIAVPSQELKRLFGFRGDVTHVSEGHKRAVAFDVEMYMSLLCYVIAEVNLIFHKKEIPPSGKKACKALRCSKRLQFVMETNGVFQEVNTDEMLSAVQLSGSESLQICSPHLLDEVQFPE